MLAKKWASWGPGASSVPARWAHHRLWSWDCGDLVCACVCVCVCWGWTFGGGPCGLLTGTHRRWGTHPTALGTLPRAHPRAGLAILLDTLFGFLLVWFFFLERSGWGQSLPMAIGTLRAFAFPDPHA